MTDKSPRRLDLVAAIGTHSLVPRSCGLLQVATVLSWPGGPRTEGARLPDGPARPSSFKSPSGDVHLMLSGGYDFEGRSLAGEMHGKATIFSGAVIVGRVK